MDSLLYVLLCLLRSGIHFTNAFTIGLSSCQEYFVYHFLAHLSSKNLIDFLIMEECHLPVLMTKVLREVFKVSCFVPLDIIKCNELALLLIRIFIDQDASKDELHS